MVFYDVLEKSRAIIPVPAPAESSEKKDPAPCTDLFYTSNAYPDKGRKPAERFHDPCRQPRDDLPGIFKVFQDIPLKTQNLHPYQEC